MPLDAHVTGLAPNGHPFRWANDSPDPTARIVGLRWSDTMPGGFDRMGGTLLRAPGVDYADLQRLSTLSVRDASGVAIGEYRLERAPRSSGDRMSATPDAVGWQAHLEDDKSASMIYIDRDLGRWSGPSAQRRLSLIASGTPHQSDASQAWETGVDASALVLAVQGEWAGSPKPRCEMWYDAGAANTLSEIRAEWSGVSDTAYSLYAIVSPDAVSSAGSVGNTTDLYSSATGSFDFRPTARYRYGRLVWECSRSGGGPGATFVVKLIGLRVHGDHGLTLRTPSGADAGYLASDIVAHAIGRWAPLLSFTRGINGTIMPSTFVIPQAAFHDKTTALGILQEVFKYELPDWAVWENRTFWMHPRGARGRRWRARAAASGLEETGPQIDRMWNGILVQYQDPDGSTRTVGPIGSGVDVEDARLSDEDPENPANQLNIRRWDLLSMGMTSTAAAAVRIGVRFLEQSRQLETSGRASFVGYIEDENGVAWPYHQVRSGDTVQFVDAADTSPRRIVRAEKDADSCTCTVDLDSPPEGLDALLARLGVVLVPLGM